MPIRDHTLRLGLVMSWTQRVNSFVEEHPESFWCVSRSVIDGEDFLVQVIYRGWHDIVSYNAGKPPLAGAEKPYQFDSAAYVEIISHGTTLPQGTPLLAEMISAVNTRAIARKDILGPDGGWFHSSRTLNQRARGRGCTIPLYCV